MKKFICNDAATVAETPLGKLRGYFYEGVYIFKGIRYAKAKRFHMPEPVEAWEGIKDASSYGYICPVLNAPMPMGEVMTPHRFWPENEHCQYLNVWTDSLDPSAKKPVMFWIHGGGYSAGSSIEQECYDGENLAGKDGVVLVSVNHRLNAFGYLDLSEFGEEYKNSVNVGMADLVEALRWVKNNIAAFGGDPDNVTIFGQSGGGGKVTTLNQIPEADGLFQKAIVMSGVIPDSLFDSCSGKELVTEILNFLHIDVKDVKKLEKVPSAQFIWAVNKASVKLAKEGKTVNWSPRPNDYYVCDPLVGDFTAHSLTVPTMVGTVIAEFGFPAQLGNREALTEEQREQAVIDAYGEEGGKKILKAFREAYPGKNVVYASDLETMFLPDTVRYVKKKAAEASAPVYNYMFAKIFDYHDGTAAGHCSDIPYFMHNAENIPVCHQNNMEKLDTLMSGAFVNFARTGNPNGGELPQWEACSRDHMVTMVFDDDCYTKINMQDELLPLVLQYKKPFKFEFALPDEDDEESGNAWVF